MAKKKEVVVEADSTLADMIKDFRDLKEQKAELNKAVKDLNPKIEYMSEIIIARLQGEGADKISTPFGTVSTSTKDYATVSDFAAFIHYIDTHQAYELIQKRPNDAPLRLVWDDEEEGGEIPGIGKFERTTLNFRKK